MLYFYNLLHFKKNQFSKNDCTTIPCAPYPILAKITPTFSVSVTVAILISDTKCSIERNDFFVILKAEVFGRELDSISGLVGVHIDL